jgi:uncharacterized repeat protein (TIGR01451 family)
VSEPAETFSVVLTGPINAAMLDNQGVGTILNDEATPAAAYVRSSTAAPWGSTANEAAMNRVFGPAGWQDLRYETLNPFLLFTPNTHFVYMEGGDNNADELEAFLNASLAAIQAWVSNGGVLFVNAAPNEGDGMNLGFGVTLNYPDFSDGGFATTPAHPIFSGPFLPVGLSWSANYFAHATLSGDGLVSLIQADSSGRSVLSEKPYGAGLMLCGGMTTDNFQTPQPHASNLRANIIAYGLSRYTAPGQLHHFAWGPIPSPALLNQPFPVVLTALDGFNTVVSNFNATVALSALAGAGPTNVTILASPNHNQSDSGVWTLGYAFTPSTNLVVTRVRHYFGSKVSLWTDAGVLLASQNVSSTPGAWTETPLDTPVPLVAGSRYRVAAFTGGGNFYWRNDLNPGFAFGQINQSYEAAGDSFPTAGDSARWWLVDLRFNVGNLVGFPITPVLSGNFTNGVWSGAITPLDVADDVRLHASDGLGHLGASEPFNVAVMNDLTLTLAGAPDPVMAARNLKYTLLLANSGPAPATGVVLTNFLPPSVTFISASSSQGVCSNAGGTVICNVGNLAAAQNVVVAIIVQPTAPGLITNLANVSRHEPDPVPANNSALVTITVFVPALSISDASVLEGDSGTTDAVFNVRLSEASPLSVGVQFATADVTAMAGSDYLATNGLLTFPPGVTNLSLRVPVRGDALHEPDETFLLNLSNPVNAVLSDALGVGIILNDDPLPSLSISNALVTEGNSGTTNAVFTVSLSARSGEPVSVSFYTIDGTATGSADYAANPSGSLVFPPGVTNRTISVAVFGDTAVEPDETFSVILIDPHGAVLGNDTGTGTILNDDFATVIVRDSSSLLSESRAPPNGVIDSGETVTVSFALRNTGNIDTSNLLATLLPAGGVTAPGAPQNYGALIGRGAPVARSFTFTAGGTNGGVLIATLQLRDGARDLGTVAFQFSLGSPQDFMILSLSDAGCSALEHAGVTGDDRGGIAASASQVFCTGDSTTARFALGDLSGGAGIGFQYDALTANLRTETVYSLGNGTNVIGFGGGTVTSLLELNGATGARTGNRIDLSDPIVVGSAAGIFAGYDRVVLHDGNVHVYNIELPSGAVSVLGAMANPPHATTESWAYWGVAEHFGGAVYLVYVRDPQSIVRTRLPDGETTLIQGFSNLSDMASITVSLSRHRWYFHHEGSSQFRTGDETIGYCNANFLVSTPAPGLDHFEWDTIHWPQTVNVPFPVTLTARDAFGNAVAAFAGPARLGGLDVSVGPATIGSGAAAWEFPLAGFFHDARTQVIYLPDEIGGPRSITALALDLLTVPGQTLSNWTIRLKHTSLAGYGPTPAWETAGWTVAHHSAASLTATGWVTFEFTAPFAYNGVDGLMLDFSFNNSSFSSDGLCRASATPGRRAIYFETDSFFGDPLLWSGSSSPMPAVAMQIPNLRLFSAPPVPVTPTLSGLFTNGVWSGFITVQQGSIQAVLSADDGLGHMGSSNPFQVFGPPLLNIRHDGSNAILTWPITSPGYNLEAADSLTPAIWTPVPNPPLAWGSVNVVTNSMTTSNRVFRLRNP